MEARPQEVQISSTELFLSADLKCPLLLFRFSSIQVPEKGTFNDRNFHLTYFIHSKEGNSQAKLFGIPTLTSYLISFPLFAWWIETMKLLFQFHRHIIVIIIIIVLRPCFHACTSQMVSTYETPSLVMIQGSFPPET